MLARSRVPHPACCWKDRNYTTRSLQLSPRRRSTRRTGVPDHAPEIAIGGPAFSDRCRPLRSHLWTNGRKSGAAFRVHWALGFVLSQGNSFPMAVPHTSTFSTLVCCGPYAICIRKSLQFRAFAVARQVLTPSMPRNLCRDFFDGKFCSANCRTSATNLSRSSRRTIRKKNFRATRFDLFCTRC